MGRYEIQNGAKRSQSAAPPGFSGLGLKDFSEEQARLAMELYYAGQALPWKALDSVIHVRLPPALGPDRDIRWAMLARPIAGTLERPR
jgi:hypothetical protein